MPKQLERELKAQARKKGFTGERADRYVYGTLRKTGWVPSHQKKPSLRSPTSDVKSYVRSKKRRRS